MSDLESIALLQSVVLVISFLYYLVFDLTLLSFVKMIEELCEAACVTLDKWMMDEEA